MPNRNFQVIPSDPHKGSYTMLRTVASTALSQTSIS